MKKFIFILTSFCVLFTFLTGCSVFGGKPANLTVDNIKVGFVYIGTIDDEGYTQAHDKGRLAIEKMGIPTAYVENVSDSDTAACQKAIKHLIKKDKCNVIFTTSYGYLEATKYMANQYPRVYFNHCSSDVSNGKNLGSYFGKIYQARFLSGIVAGLKTDTNKIGYVAAFAIPECIRGINAFTLGAQMVNPDVVVEVQWTSTWFDPSAEKHAALLLLEDGCDIIAQHQDTTAAQIAAQERNAFCIGYNIATPDSAPLAYLTAPVFNWQIYYIQTVTSILNKSWSPEFVWKDIATGVVDLDYLSPLCPPQAKEYIEDYKYRMRKGLFEPFSGPILDQHGIERVTKNEEMTEEEIWNMNWFVQGVQMYKKN